MKELDEKNCLFKKICEQLELYINEGKLVYEKYWNVKRLDAKKIKKETLLSDLYFESVLLLFYVRRKRFLRRPCWARVL